MFHFSLRIRFFPNYLARFFKGQNEKPKKQNIIDTRRCRTRCRADLCMYRSCHTGPRVSKIAESDVTNFIVTNLSVPKLPFPQEAKTGFNTEPFNRFFDDVQTTRFSIRFDSLRSQNETRTTSVYFDPDDRSILEESRSFFDTLKPLFVASTNFSERVQAAKKKTLFGKLYSTHHIHKTKNTEQETVGKCTFGNRPAAWLFIWQNKHIRVKINDHARETHSRERKTILTYYRKSLSVSSDIYCFRLCANNLRKKKKQCRSFSMYKVNND